jgi:outer membrane lipoprotein-sorting protein
MTDDYRQVIERARNLQEFEVQVTVPGKFHFDGTIPYDMEIVGNQAFVTILAETVEEATATVKEYFNSRILPDE